MKSALAVSALLVPLLVGCFDSDDLIADDYPERLSPVNREDSLAIVEMKQAAGVWNGTIRDWVYNTGADSKVVELHADIGGNASVVFPQDGLDSLRFLWIETDLDTLTVLGLRHLDALQLFRRFSFTTKLSKWPRGIFENPRVRDLRLRSQNLDHISDSIVMIDSLKYLDLGYNSISAIPPFILEKVDFFVRLEGNRLCNPTADEIAWLNAHADWSHQNCPQ